MKSFNNMDDLFKEIKNNPNKYLDDQAKEILVGKTTTGLCPVCNVEHDVEILANGKVKGLTCGNEFDLDITWDIE